jgi:DNA-binding CsgD family transcriptional regulator
VQVRLAHPVHGDVVRTGISALRERRIARSLAEVIEATGGRRRDDPLRLASLRLVGGGGSAALLVTGAMAARRRNDHALTERLARAAITEGGGRPARLLAAEAAHLQGRPSQSERELAELAAEAQAAEAQAAEAQGADTRGADPPTDAERARVALLRFDNAFFLRGRADFRLLDDAAAAIDDPFWCDELQARRRYVTDLSNGPRVAVAALSPVRPGTTTPTGHIQTAYSLARLGRLDEAMQLLRPPPGGGLIPAADASWEQWDLFAARVIPLVYAGRLGEAEELLTLAYGQVIAQPAAEGGGYADSRLAYLHLEQGRPMSAFRRGSQACALFQQLRRPFLARWGYIAAAHALALAGQAGRAAETLAALDALGLPTIPAAEADLLQARAWTAAAAGNLPAARRQLDAAAGLGEQIGDLIGATTALHSLARLGGSRQVAARLTALAAEVDGDLTTARAAYASAAADRDSEALGKISREFENLGALLYAAEASAEAATALRAVAQGRAAAAAEQRAARLLARCEGAATPPVRVITRRVRLTPGELDSALQAAAGHSNKQIAAGLQLSVRTVESHLQRAYEKLGISRRRDLASALRDQPFSSHHPGNQ